MRNHRKWWMGLGLGIALGAMMLQLIDFAMEQPVLIADGGKIYTQKQLDDAVGEAIRQLPPPSSQAPTVEPGSGSPGDGAAPPPPGSGADGTDPAGSGPAGTGPAAGPVDGTTQERLVVAFYVNKGMSLIAVARSLQALGVIDDADDFTQAARPISQKIKVGTASFTGQPTYDEIIAELTRKKDS